jgi:hypothetical protein
MSKTAIYARPMSHHFARSDITGEILLSEYREPPPTCDICDAVDVMTEPHGGMGTNKRRHPGKRLQEKIRDIFDNHPKCKVCKILMGGTHTGGLEEDSEEGMCSYCRRRSDNG